MVAVPGLGVLCLFCTEHLFRIIAVLLLITRGSQAYFGITSTKPKQIDFSTITHRQPGDCRMLYLSREQRKQCYKDPGMGETLTEALVLSLEECKEQFENERWNCSIDHQPYRLNLIRAGLKESSFMFALSSAALATTIARSCSSGVLSESCTCDLTSFSDEVNADTWRWGGCGDNMKYSQMFLRSFLRYPQRQSSSDFPTIVDRHNSDLGIRTVKKNYVKKCKCHGVSGACETNTCWRQIKPFKVIGNDIKMKYERALKVTVENVANDMGVELVTSNSKNRPGTAPSKGHMIYRNRSPDFCSRDRYSPGTAARECNKTATCDSICCGRGYNIREATLTEKCRCTFEWCCVVHCHICTRNVEIAMCRV